MVVIGASNHDLARIGSLSVLGLMMGVGGCRSALILDRIAPEAVQAAKTNFDYLRHGQYDRIEPSVDASVERSYLRAELARMAAKVPRQDPISVKTVGAYVECETRKGCDTRVTLEYEFPSSWILVQMVLHRQGGNSTITSFYVDPESKSLEAANRFTLRGRRGLPYVILSGTIAMFVAFALISWIIRTRRKSRVAGDQPRE